MTECFNLYVYSNYETKPFSYDNDHETTKFIYDELCEFVYEPGMRPSTTYLHIYGEYEQYDIFMTKLYEQYDIFMTKLYDISEHYPTFLFELNLPSTFTDNECNIYIVGGRSYVQEAIVPEFDPYLMDVIGTYRT